ncbi:MAG TPA: hypothetical protein VHD90_14340 [Phototrophicaceae bacterium]|nr:hypothetical protein [Phototrophicaceae bacterium]
MRRIVIFIGFLLLSLVIATSTIAQAATCSDVVNKALQDLSSTCENMQRNSACYGFNHVMATFADSLTPSVFNQPNDRVDLASLQSITTSPLDVQTSQWGIAVMKVQANIPDALPGQAVTFLLFGDVHLQTGVTAGSGEKPMQAVYFTTGIGDTKCTDAPSSSLIIQGPKNLTVDLSVNGAKVKFGSTLIFRSTPNSSMSCGVLDGEALVGPDQTRIPNGFAARVPLDSSLNANGDWGTNQTISDQDADQLQVLKDLPPGILSYTPDVPTSQEVNIMGALDAKLVLALDPHVMRDLVHILIAEGATAEGVAIWDVPTLRAFVANNASKYTQTATETPSETGTSAATTQPEATEPPSPTATLQGVLNALDTYIAQQAS